MKNNSLTITLIVLLSIIALSLTGFLVYAMVKGDNMHFNFNFSNKSMKLIDSYETEITTLEDIKLNLYSTDVEIKESENEKVLVEYYSNKENNPKIDYTDTKIEINEEKYDVSCIGFCNQRRKTMVKNSKIQIY